MNNRTSIVNISGDFEESLIQFSRHLGTSQLRRKLFAAVYGRGEKPRSKKQLMAAAGIPSIGNVGQQAQNELDHLAKHHLILKTKNDGKVEDGSRNLYGKDQTVRANRDKIISFADNPGRAANIATKRSQKIQQAASSATVTVIYKDVAFPPRELTVDDIDSFSRVRAVSSRQAHLAGLSEEKFKHGIQDIIAEHGTFKDWGGEKSDLLSTRLLINGKRRSVAFAFKGPGQSGALTPARMGKNGDQALRLFEEVADVYVVQHWREISSSVRSLVHSLAIAHSVLRKKAIVYCFIDGQDSQRIVDAYPRSFA